jgi:hypothetical protein
VVEPARVYQTGITREQLREFHRMNREETVQGHVRAALVIGGLPMMRLRCSKDGYLHRSYRHWHEGDSNATKQPHQVFRRFGTVEECWCCIQEDADVFGVPSSGLHNLVFFSMVERFGANPMDDIVRIRMDKLTPGVEFALDKDLRKLLIWTKSKIAAAMDGEKPFENIELEGLMVRQTIPPLVRSHYALRIERAQELYMEAGDFDLTLVQTRSGDHGPITRFGTVKLIGVKASFFLNQKGIVRYKQLVENMSSLFRVSNRRV